MPDPQAIRTNVEQDYPDHLRDESRRTGRAASISFPKTEDELRGHLELARAHGLTVTIQGARTGITGGAVPDGGHILNLSLMKRMTGLRRHPSTGEFLLTVQPGACLSEVRDAVAHRSFETDGWPTEALAAAEAFAAAPPHFFSPDPTETSASIGGMTACNASGALSFRYGPTRQHVHGARIVLADGDVLALERGRPRSRGRTFALTCASGRRIEGVLPSYAMPDVKSAAGYFARDDMDLLDLFIGAEGTLGVFSAIELRLIPVPAARWGIAAFLPGEAEAVDFVEQIRRQDAGPVAIEFFSRGALDLLRRQKETNPAFKDLPALHPEWHTAVYVEYHGPDEQTVENAVEEMSDTLAACGGDMEATWLAADERDMEQLKAFRHAVPESVNLLIDERRKKEPKLTKLGTDLAVPDGELANVLEMYNRDLRDAGLEYVIFGHIGNNHVHVNIIPNTLADYDRGKALYLDWARRVVQVGGTVSAEHGIGKLKTALLELMYGEAGIGEMRRVKRSFDPDGVLNPGDLFTTPAMV